jgi:hypothetical protein
MKMSFYQIKKVPGKVIKSLNLREQSSESYLVIRKLTLMNEKLKKK